MSKNLAIIGASFLQLPLIEKAKSMGYITHVFAWAAGDVGEAAADYFYPISIVEKEEILRICRQLDICGICSIASDLAMITVSYVAEKMGLVGNSSEATAKSTNKHRMRNAFREGGDPSPWSVMVENVADLRNMKIRYPIIVKPTDRSGSRGITKLLSEDGLENAVSEAMSVSFEKKVLIEEYVSGQEYSVEYISFQGKHHFLAMTLKSTTGAPHFIETGHLEPAPVENHLLEQVKAVVEHALNTLGIRNGASHSELKIDEHGTIKLIEIGGRMGGDCIGSDLVAASTGYDFVKMVIDVACGKEPDFTKIGIPRPTAVRFIFTQKDLAEFAELREKHPERIIKVVDMHPEKIGTTTDSSNRAGCYIYLP